MDPAGYAGMALYINLLQEVVGIRNDAEIILQRLDNKYKIRDTMERDKSLDWQQEHAWELMGIVSDIVNKLEDTVERAAPGAGLDADYSMRRIAPDEARTGYTAMALKPHRGAVRN